MSTNIPLEVTPEELSALIAATVTMLLMASEAKAKGLEIPGEDLAIKSLTSLRKKVIAAQTAHVLMSRASQP